MTFYIRWSTNLLTRFALKWCHDRIRHNAHKLKYKKICLRKAFFTVRRVVNCWNRLPRGVVVLIYMV